MSIFIVQHHAEEKYKLVTYIEAYEIPRRNMHAIAINKYVLLHYKDYLSQQEIEEHREAKEFAKK